MTELIAERCRMHRHSDEDVADVVMAAVARLRSREGRPGIFASLPLVADTVRQVRSGTMPRAQYEAARGPGDPEYGDLPAERRDEDRLLWFITQALTGD